MLLTFGWAVVQVRLQSERRFAHLVNERLAEYHCCYCPVRKDWTIVRRPGRTGRYREMVEHPVFSGYNFLKVVDADYFQESVLNTVGIWHQVMRNQGDLLIVPDEEIELIRQKEARNEYSFRPTKEMWIKVGELVEVVEGPFKGYRGVVEKSMIDSGHHIIDFGKNFSKVQVHMSHVRRANQVSST